MASACEKCGYFRVSCKCLANALEAENKRLKEAVSLLNSMILGGEIHTSLSRRVVEEALKPSKK